MVVGFLTKGRSVVCLQLLENTGQKILRSALVIVGTKQEMDYYERYLIVDFGTRAPNGYNLDGCGEGTPVTHVSAEGRRKMSVHSNGLVSNFQRHPEV